MALAHAGIPMTDLVVSVASGKVNDIVVCDLNKEEDNYGEADLPMGILPNTGELVFLQMDGDLSQEEFNTAWDYNMEAASKIHEEMARALKGVMPSMSIPLVPELLRANAMEKLAAADARIDGRGRFEPEGDDPRDRHTGQRRGICAGPDGQHDRAGVKFQLMTPSQTADTRWTHVQRRGTAGRRQGLGGLQAQSLLSSGESSTARHRGIGVHRRR